ncbi:MAG TPA: histidine phosphatase family protein, partial [Actinomycetota bacterium]|nr:histidine phosphatase family protein [Actinomycetota bacterium]
MTQTLIHLVRHAEVENPDNIWYGRLEGFVLSERGLRQIVALADHLALKPIAAVYSSPLTRAVQTAEAIAASHGLPVKVIEEIIESEAKLQGLPGDRRLFRNPANLRYFVNPLRPSWGEPYRSIRERMGRAVAAMR